MIAAHDLIQTITFLHTTVGKRRNRQDRCVSLSRKNRFQLLAISYLIVDEKESGRDERSERVEVLRGRAQSRGRHRVGGRRRVGVHVAAGGDGVVA